MVYLPSSLCKNQIKLMLEMKRKLKLIMLLIGTLGIACCSPVTEYNIYGNIKGVVTDYDTNQLIEGASIMIIPGNQTIMSGAEGEFEFVDLDSGQYTLSVQKSGYQANRKIVNVLTGETVSTAITLTKIPTE